MATPAQFAPCPRPPLESLRELIAECRIALPEDLPPPSAGLFGYLGYDMVRQMEHLPDINPDVLDTPDAILIRPTIVVVFDSVKDMITIVTPVRPEQGVSVKTALARATDRLTAIVDALDQPLPKSMRDTPESIAAAAGVEHDRRMSIASMVLRAKEYIAAGDIFQVVLSQRFSTPFDLSPFSLYRALRRVNPAPFSIFSTSTASRSPDRARKSSSACVMVVSPFVPLPVRARAARRRVEDAALERELLADPKECAEHLMLLDLGRNDVGRVSPSAASMSPTSSSSNATARSCISSPM